MRIFDYCIHTCNGVMEGKFGSCFVFRRGARPFSLVTWLVRSTDVVGLLSAVLTDILAANHIRMPKTSTKAAKIRRLLSMDEITKSCSKEEIDRVESILKEQESKRKQKKDPENEEAENKDEDQERLCLLWFL